MNASVLKIAVSSLAAAFLLCVAGIIWLASANPARDIPDILVATTTGILGLVGGILVPSKRELNERGESAANILLGVAALLLILWLALAIIR